jgi:hypothetical protein
VAKPQIVPLSAMLPQGLVPGENISCTACAGTLLLEFGLLSRLTGKPSYEAAARHAARVLFDQRSGLGLVGSGFHVFSRTWSHRDSTIGPGSDSYYEYLLKVGGAGSSLWTARIARCACVVFGAWCERFWVMCVLLAIVHRTVGVAACLLLMVWSALHTMPALSTYSNGVL